MSQGVLYWDVPLAKKNLIRALEHQYADGFALRGWHPLDPMRYVDCASWLISAITEYIKETGDFAILDEVVNYLDEGRAPVYEHLMQIMRRLRADRGAHGLCLAFFGDWNDSLTGVCKKGRGESVWMSMAFSRCSLLMEELAQYLGHTEDAATLWKWRKEMADAINEHAWDGKWYLCALDDDGNPIGSESNEEGKLYLNMQSWAQLGRVCDDSRWESSFASVEKHLDSGWGLMLNWPTYTKPTPNVGRLSYLRPGICENGSVYTHGVAFMYLALLERGLADKALKVYRDIHPGNQNRPVSCQPNVVINGYDGPDTDREPGEAQHAWTTGSASWLISCTIEYMLGLRRTYDDTTYNVTLKKKKGIQAPPVKSITIDGRSHPVEKPLLLDGRKHKVEVVLE
jgi:cellobiose phosphorylase